MARVLLIEDEPNIAMILEIFLSEQGHEVITSSDGLSGLRRLEQEPLPSIVVVDLFMPGVDGRVVVETIYRSLKLRHIPVVVISGSIPGSANLPPKGSYSAFISKPFDLDEVAKTVEKLTGAIVFPNTGPTSVVRLPPSPCCAKSVWESRK